MRAGWFDELWPKSARDSEISEGDAKAARPMSAEEGNHARPAKASVTGTGS
jgi:hypothetical protein